MSKQINSIFLVLFISCFCYAQQGKSESKTSVLLIGDSHTCLAFGSALDRGLRDHFGKEQVVTIGRSGERSAHFLYGNHSTTYGWVEYLADGRRLSGEYGSSKLTPKLTDLINKHDPQTVIIALGANEIWRPANLSSHLSKLAKSVTSHNKRCFWIAPPTARCDDKKCVYSKDALATYYSILSANIVSLCKIIESNSSAMPFLDFTKLSKKAGTTGDGIHHDSLGKVGRKAARQWANHVLQVVITK